MTDFPASKSGLLREIDISIKMALDKADYLHCSMQR